MDAPQHSSCLTEGCMFLRAISFGSSRSVIVLRDDENGSCSVDHFHIADEESRRPLTSHTKRLAALTASNIQVHRNILKEEEECRRSFMLQEGSHGIEALLIPTRRMVGNLTTDRHSADGGGGIPCQSPLQSLDTISVIFGQVQSDHDDDSSTLIVLTAENNSKNSHNTKIHSHCSAAMKEPTTIGKKEPIHDNLKDDDTFTTLSVTTGTSWTDIDSEGGQRSKGSGGHGRKLGFLKRRRKQRQQQWMASLHNNLEPTKNDDSMEMIFFETLAVCKEEEEEEEEETFYFHALPRLPSGEQ